ncbi:MULTISPECIES: sensor domain-containing diguanylate cyclase [unclassified Acidovorax]|uniref:sensor domain-containing diguanylate cyclase n=1 Tax=unclassified Acidovorax TaxID=2684926 RepID=UPI001CE1FE20|nr:MULTISPECIES: sensor domain-containing diguanylate cyclase [unclassified Acidovorax]
MTPMTELPPPKPADGTQIQAALCNPQRLAAVRETGLLDSIAEESFDRLTRLASKITGAPVTFISLVDSRRDFYKSTFGMGAPLNTQRQLTGRTFCHYAMVSEGPLVLEDATVLPVFRDVPTVASLGVRAYAGIPLKNEAGEVLGSFCAVDFKPKQWTQQDIEVLVELAHSTMREIRLRRALQSAETLNQQLLQQLQKVDELNLALNELARTDPLTGLRNRRAFDDSLELELAVVERTRSPLSLLMLDVDHFKQINDNFGHAAGDKVLRSIAQVLSGCVRIIDIVARVGGEEFAVILPHTDATGAHEVAQRMRVAVAQASWLCQPTTISIGAASLRDAESARSLFARADAALYAAKRSGRNRVVAA